jgi:hypothetical protein
LLNAIETMSNYWRLYITFFHFRESFQLVESFSRTWREKSPTGTIVHKSMPYPDLVCIIEGCYIPYKPQKRLAIFYFLAHDFPRLWISWLMASSRYLAIYLINGLVVSLYRQKSCVLLLRILFGLLLLTFRTHQKLNSSLRSKRNFGDEAAGS